MGSGGIYNAYISQIMSGSGRIPAATLQSWAGPGASATAKYTHEAIRGVISQTEFAESLRPTVYLQGSYKNDTHVRGDSDVDIVVEFPYSSRLLILASDSQAWLEYRNTVLRALQNNFRSLQITAEKKCIKVSRASWSLAADIVIAFPHRQQLLLPYTNDLVQYGIKFFVPTEGRWIINYPKQHYENGVLKNSPAQTNGWYKPVVRIFKNAVAVAGLNVPSYFLECLIYNVPDQHFGVSYQNSFDSVLNYLASSRLGTFTCANRQISLVGNTQEQWSTNQAIEVIRSLLHLRSRY